MRATMRRGAGAPVGEGVCVDMANRVYYGLLW